MGEANENRVPILLWPFYAIWRLLTLILNVVGRLLCATLGLLIMIAGVLVTMSVVGAPLGIPLAALGFLLLIRAVF
ncbi:MAG: hypothetical protein WBN07_00810 [Woeseiaceae bacterium]|jgi:hypothetical protein